MMAYLVDSVDRTFPSPVLLLGDLAEPDPALLGGLVHVRHDAIAVATENKTHKFEFDSINFRYR